jgi:hypothetical protein
LSYHDYDGEVEKKLQKQNNIKPTRSRQLAFEASNRWWLIVLQHLLLAMNAHINLHE